MKINRLVFLFLLLLGLLAGIGLAMTIARTVDAPAAGTPTANKIAIHTVDPVTPTRDRNRIIVDTFLHDGTPYWKYDDGEECCWREGTGPEPSRTPWPTWTPMPEPTDVAIVNINAELGIAEIENRSDVPIMFVPNAVAAEFVYFDQRDKDESIDFPVYPGYTYDGRESVIDRYESGTQISCVVFPGERGYVLEYPYIDAEDAPFVRVHYTLHGVPRPDIASRKSDFLMPYENIEWRVEGGKLLFSFDVEKFDPGEIYYKKGYFSYLGLLFLYARDGRLINVLRNDYFDSTGGGHIEAWTMPKASLFDVWYSKGEGGFWKYFTLSAAPGETLGEADLAITSRSLSLDQIDHVHLRIEKLMQPDCIQYLDKTYVFTPTSKPSATATPTP